MWGFYLVHARRMTCRASVPRPGIPLMAASAAYCAVFAAVTDADLLLLLTLPMLAGLLACDRDRQSRRCALYLIAVGALFEYSGVWSGAWSYPHHPIGGVPVWFITLWGGAGFFLARFLHPLFHTTFDHPRAVIGLRPAPAIAGLAREASR
jgi:uncharacterized membrane protein YoaT (DUF817 family)